MTLCGYLDSTAFLRFLYLVEKHDVKEINILTYKLSHLITLKLKKSYENNDVGKVTR